MKPMMRIARMGLWLGATVFGGVAVAYPLIRERAGELGDISGEEVDGLYALSVFLPGPSFLNLWGAVSVRAGGLLGAVVGQVALLLPAFALVMLLSLLNRIEYIRTHADGALNGAIWATAGLLVAAGIDGVRKVKTGTERAMVALGLAALLLGLHPVLLLVLVMAWGAVTGLGKTERKAA